MKTWPWSHFFINDKGQAALVYLGILAISFLVALFLPKIQMSVALGAGIGIFFFIVSFVKTEIALYLLIFSMLLSPEIGIGGGGGVEGMEASRAVALRMEDLLLVVMGLSYLGRMATDKDIGVVGKTPLNKYIGLYFAVCILATLIGAMRGSVRSISGFFFVLKYFEYYVVFYAVINYIHKEEQVKSFIAVIMLTCLVVCIVAAAQIPLGGRVTAPFEGGRGEPNTLGGYLVLILALNGGLYFHLATPWIRKLVFCNFFVILIPLMATGSRASWLALPFVYIVWIIFSKKKAQLVIFGLLMALLLPSVMPKTVKQRFLYTFRQKLSRTHAQVKVGGLRLDTSTSARLESMKGVFRDVQNRPFFGFGVTGYRFLDAQFFKVLADTGILGLAAFVALILRIGREIYRVYRTVRSPLHKGIAHGFLAGFIGMLVHSLGSNTFIIVRIMEPFWFLAGIVMMLPELEKEEAASAALQEQGASLVLHEGVQDSLKDLPGPAGPPGSLPGPGRPPARRGPDTNRPLSGRNVDWLR